jgi:glycosyltransferase involved in cell wall biosynthesis
VSDKLSAVIITFNEEKNIGRCIASVKDVADEVVVLDSFSTDQTVLIATQNGATVHQQAFAGYIEQKNKALELATSEHVLCLDADEALDETLARSIQAEKEKVFAAGYSMNRCTSYCGKLIRHGNWYPDRKLRLFNKRLGRWGGINPHDRVVFDRPRKTRVLPGDILHYSYNNLEEHVLQNNRFSTISAESYFDRGIRSNWLKMLANPCWTFTSGYLLKAGFLDGYFGLVIAINNAHLTFMKYYKLQALQNNIPIK